MKPVIYYERKSTQCKKKELYYFTFVTMRISTLKDTRSHGAYFLFLAVMVPYVNKYGTKYISACCLLPTIKNNYARVVEGKEMIFGYAGPGWKRPTEREMPFRNSGCRFSCSNSLLAKG